MKPIPDTLPTRIFFVRLWRWHIALKTDLIDLKQGKQKSLMKILSLPLQISKPHGHAFIATNDVALVLQMHSLRRRVFSGLRPLMPPLRNQLPRRDRDDATATTAA
ncbi:hypothetical protein TB1_019180 [Malus domestica]